jgi:hypothetical protein
MTNISAAPTRFKRRKRLIRHVPDKQIRGNKVAIDEDDKAKERVLINAIDPAQYVIHIEDLPRVASERGMEIGGVLVSSRETTNKPRQKRMMERRSAFCGYQTRAHGLRVIKRFRGAGETGKGPGVAPCHLKAAAESERLEKRTGKLYPVLVDSLYRLLRNGLPMDESENDWHKTMPRTARFKALKAAAPNTVWVSCLPPNATSEEINEHERILGKKEL